MAHNLFYLYIWATSAHFGPNHILNFLWESIRGADFQWDSYRTSPEGCKTWVNSISVLGTSTVPRSHGWTVPEFQLPHTSAGFRWQQSVPTPDSHAVHVPMELSSADLVLELRMLILTQLSRLLIFQHSPKQDCIALTLYPYYTLCSQFQWIVKKV